jgi:DNA polymerase III subunit chi
VTEIAFHFNAPERLGYALRLLRKAYGAGARVAVTADDATLKQLDQALWTMAPLAFVPHAHAEQSAMVVQHSPIVLAQNLGALPHYEVLVNLSDDVPAGFERFERLIEVVTTQEEQRQAARARWRHYSERGYAMTRHDLGAAP